jgi:hypothetical protein
MDRRLRAPFNKHHRQGEDKILDKKAGKRRR